jgi:hypothetical protein
MNRVEGMTLLGRNLSSIRTVANLGEACGVPGEDLKQD